MAPEHLGEPSITVQVYILFLCTTSGSFLFHGTYILKSLMCACWCVLQGPDC